MFLILFASLTVSLLCLYLFQTDENVFITIYFSDSIEMSCKYIMHNFPLYQSILIPFNHFVWQLASSNPVYYVSCFYLFML